MKKLIIISITLLFCSVMFTNCSDSKQIKAKVYSISSNHKDTTLVDTVINAKPYGWLNMNDRIEGVEYRANVGDIIWSVLLVETIFAPILITGFDIMEPVGLESESPKHIKIAQ